MNFSNYRPEEFEGGGGSNLKEGDYRVRIDNIEEKVSQKGQDMLVLTLAIREADFVFKFYIVDNEYFNRNMTTFYDCFKIPRGNTETHRWMGRMGTAHIAKGKVRDNGKSYWEIAYLIVDRGASAPAQTPPPPKQPAPNYQAPPSPDGFADDIPF